MTDDKGRDPGPAHDIDQRTDMTDTMVIKGGCRFIKQQHARPPEQRGGKGDQLSLPARKVAPAPFNPGFIAIGKIKDEFMRPRQLGRLNDVAHFGIAKTGNIFGNRPGKQERVL